MKKKRFLVAMSLASALVLGSGALVVAATNDSLLPCADIIDGSGNYTAPKQEKEAVTNKPTWVTDGSVTFDLTLAAPTCFNVQYGFVVLDKDPVVDGDGIPTVLASSSVPGDGIADNEGRGHIRFQLPVPSDPNQTDVCVYLYTTGASGTSSTGKTGAAFDGTSGSQLLDRAPDFTTTSDGGYCNYLPDTGSRGYN